jgi:hypothetical protein
MDGMSKFHWAVTVFNTGSIVALGLYIQRSNSAMSAEITRLSEALASTLKSIEGMRGDAAKIPQVIAAITRLDQDIRATQDGLLDLTPSTEFFELITKLNESFKHIENGGVDIPPVQLASQYPQYYPQPPPYYPQHQQRQGPPPPQPYHPRQAPPQQRAPPPQQYDDGGGDDPNYHQQPISGDEAQSVLERARRAREQAPPVGRGRGRGRR